MVQMKTKFDELGVRAVKARLASKVFLGTEPHWRSGSLIRRCTVGNDAAGLLLKLC